MIFSRAADQAVLGGIVPIFFPYLSDFAKCSFLLGPFPKVMNA